MVKKSYRRKDNPEEKDGSYGEKLRTVLGEIDSFDQAARVFSRLPLGSRLEKLVYPIMEELAKFDTLEEASFIYEHSPKDSSLEERAYKEMERLADLPSVKSYEDALKVCELAPLPSELRKEACKLMVKYAETYDEYYGTLLKLPDKSELEKEVMSKLLEKKPGLTRALVGSF